MHSQEKALQQDTKVNLESVFFYQCCCM